MLVQFELSDNLLLEKFNNYINDNDAIHTILSLGIDAYKRHLDFINSYEHNNIVDDLKQEFIKKDNERIEEINKLKQGHGVDVSIVINDAIKSNNNEKNNQINFLYSKINDLENNTKDLNNKLIQAYQFKNDDSTLLNQINQMNTTINEYVNRIMNINTYKGKQGELFILDYLQNNFSNAVIENVASTSEAGDLLFSIDNLKLLVESKNVKNIRKTEIEKFYRDIDSNTNKINAALLISLNNTNLVNCKKNFHIEIRNNIFIIMISDVFNNPSLIKYSVLLLIELLNNFNILLPHNSNNDFTLLSNYVNEIYNTFHNSYNLLQAEKDLLNKMNDLIIKKENELFNFHKIFTNINTSFPTFNFKTPLKLNTINISLN